MPQPDPRIAKKLIETYTPILYHHVDEAFVPVSPKVYMEHVALWTSTPPKDNKLNWGTGPSSGDYPREPLLPANALSVNPADDGTADTDGDGVNDLYIATYKGSNQIYLKNGADRELFFDFGGWNDGDRVTDTSTNLTCNRQRILNRYAAEQPLIDSRCRFFAEVDNQDTLISIVGLLKEKGLSPQVLWDLITTEGYIIWYYYFYPYHEENTKDCVETVGGGTDGSYEGDWQAIAVVVRSARFSPDEHPDYVGYGSRVRGLLPKDLPMGLSQGFKVVPWYQLKRELRHAKVYVGRGSHNFYPNEGARDAPGSIITEISCKGVDIGKDTYDEAVKAGQSFDDAIAAVVIAAKVIGIPIAGLIWGIVEACEQNWGGTTDKPTDPAKQMDHPPEQDHYGTIVAPQNLAGALPEASKATRVEAWAGSPDEWLMDRDLDIWWTYEGRWGVRVQQDPNDRRSGMKFPREDFRLAFLIGLLQAMSPEPQK